jgi:phosphatidylinositol kinase/protein kinase (PI-3  family)
VCEKAGAARRESLLRAAGGPEEFLAMRATFAASLAAVSVTGYVTGAGDRHTENLLVHTSSGTLVPIDFG